MNAPTPVEAEKDANSGAGEHEATAGAPNEPWVSSPPIASGPRSRASADSEQSGAAASDRTVDAPAPNARASQSWDRALSADAAPTRASRAAPAVVTFTPFVRSQASQGAPASDFVRVSAFDRAADAEVRTLNGAVLVGPSNSAALSGRPNAPVAPMRATRELVASVPVPHREVATGGFGDPNPVPANVGEPRFAQQIDGDALLVDGSGWGATAVRIKVQERSKAAEADRPRPRASPVLAAPPVPPRAAEGTSAAADVPGDAAPGPIVVEPEKVAVLLPLPTINDLRASLGWAPIERAPVAAQRGGGVADAPGSEQAVTESPIADVLFINAKGTPEGAYTEHLYEILQARWLAQDLDIESRAIGKQGDVTVVFRVDRSGRVDYLDVTRSSGNDALDAMARNAVPARLPRFPKEVKQQAIVQQVLFAYQNPMLVVDPQ